MITNLSLPLSKTSNKYKTYFIHIKKSQINDLDDINMIKNLLDDKLNIFDSIDSIDSININDFKIINKKDLENKSIKDIGKYFKSNKISTCQECFTDIKQHCVFKELVCKHRFHVNCIDPKLKKDIYKKCTKCCSENVTCLI
jgi:hypothetical protein